MRRRCSWTRNGTKPPETACRHVGGTSFPSSRPRMSCSGGAVEAGRRRSRVGGQQLCASAGSQVAIVDADIGQSRSDARDTSVSAPSALHSRDRATPSLTRSSSWASPHPDAVRGRFAERRDARGQGPAALRMCDRGHVRIRRGRVRGGVKQRKIEASILTSSSDSGADVVRAHRSAASRRARSRIVRLPASCEDSALQHRRAPRDPGARLRLFAVRVR
jgi:hypothetical protein